MAAFGTNETHFRKCVWAEPLSISAADQRSRAKEAGIALKRLLYTDEASQEIIATHLGVDVSADAGDNLLLHDPCTNNVCACFDGSQWARACGTLQGRSSRTQTLGGSY